MWKNNFIIFFIACVWASKAAAAPSSLRNRMLLQCDKLDTSECRNYEDRCEVIRVSGEKNYCDYVKTYERCTNFKNEVDCWAHHPNCVWGYNQECEDRSSATRSSALCKNNNDCHGDEVCVALRFSSDPCLADSLGQCIHQPSNCPTTKEEVCGCDGTTYKNECECLKSGENIKYEAACSANRDTDFRTYVRNLDDYGDVTDDLLWQYMYSSVSTDGRTCLTEQECKKQSRDIDHRSSFRVVSDPYNCGCYEWKGSAYWSDHNNCSGQKKRTLSLQGSRERIHCDLNRIYRDVRNVPIDTCLQVSECDDQCYHDNLSEVKIKTDPYSDMCGCYRRGNQCYYNACGDNIDKASDILPGDYQRVWCQDRNRGNVRDVVEYTCLNQDDCEEQGDINGDVKTPAIVKDFNSDNICGCYSKGGQLYWAECNVRGNFYGELTNKKTRIHCDDVGTRSRSYRVFDREHSHLHTHPHDIEDHYYDYGPV